MVQLQNCQIKKEKKAVEDVYDHQINEENHARKTMRDTQKMNQRSASYHFSMNAGDGSEIVENAGGTVETRAQFGSPMTKSVR